MLLHKPLLRNRNGAQNGAVFFLVRLVRCWLLKRARHTQFGGFGTKCARSHEPSRLPKKRWSNISSSHFGQFGTTVCMGLRLSLRCPVLVNLLCPCTIMPEGGKFADLDASPNYQLVETFVADKILPSKSTHTRSHTHAQSARTHSVTRSSTFGSVSRRFALLLLLSAPPRARVPFFLHPAKVVFCLFWRRSLLRRRARGAYTASPRPSQRVSRQVSRSARVSWEAACGLCHCRRPVRSLSC